MKRGWLNVVGYILAVIAFAVCAYVLSFVLTTEKRLTFGTIESWTEKPFYTLPDTIPEGKPGQLLRSEKLASAPNGIVGWRILYYSSDINGKSIIVSGLVAAPDKSSPTKRQVVSWGHPTTGTAPRCAPSVGIDPFDSIEGLRDLVGAGYVVAATDYSGMGLEGQPSFLIGKMEGQNVLDAARAAQQLLATNAGSDVILWGHSQGGHASLFAEQLASSYAPNLTIKGVAVAAPATELGQLLEDNSSTVAGVTIGSYAIDAYSKTYGADINTILTTDGVAATPQMTPLCLLGQNDKLHDIARPLIGNYFLQDPSKKEPWAAMLSENTPGKAKIEAPLFVAQGEADTLIDPQITQQFVNSQKTLGADVTYVTIPNTGHGMVALKAMPDMLIWLKKL